MSERRRFRQVIVHRRSTGIVGGDSGFETDTLAYPAGWTSDSNIKCNGRLRPDGTGDFIVREVRGRLPAEPDRGGEFILSLGAGIYERPQRRWTTTGHLSRFGCHDPRCPEAIFAK